MLKSPLTRGCHHHIRNNGIRLNDRLTIPNRQFWQSIDVAFNKPDEKRIKQIGPDLACAEWLLRCGGQVRWVDTNRFEKDYNRLAVSPSGRFIEEVNADNVGINAMGFKHFDGCKYIKKIRLHRCNLVWDSALWDLPAYLKDSLEELEISSCGDVSEEGLKACIELPLLKVLVLYDLPRVRDPKKAYEELKQGLPKCEVKFADASKDT